MLFEQLIKLIIKNNYLGNEKLLHYRVLVNMGYVKEIIQILDSYH